MTNKTNEVQQDASPTSTPATTSGWLTREDFATVLGCSISTVRRRERDDVLHPIADAEGTRWFDPREVVRAVRDRSTRAGVGSKEGERDARVFELLEEGLGLRKIVTTLRLPAELVGKLSAQWREAGRHDFFVSAARKAELEALTGHFDDAVALIDRVRFQNDTRGEAYEQLAKECLDAQNHLADVLSSICEVVRRRPDVAAILAHLRVLLAAPVADLLDRACSCYAEVSNAPKNAG